MSPFRCTFLCVLIIFQSWSSSFSQTLISGTINTSIEVTAVNNICPEVVSLSSSAGLAIGDKVLLIQHKGATINSNSSSPDFGQIASIENAGNFELLTILSITGNDIRFENELIHTYDASGKVQMIHVPVYSGTVNVIGTLTSDGYWDGTKGGVLVLIADTVVLNANIDTEDRGFSRGIKAVPGGSSSQCTIPGYAWASGTDGGSTIGGTKGEGIAEDASSRNYGRSPMGNGGGGGNNHNAGGGGGANYSPGGQGGESFGNCANCTDNPTVCTIPLDTANGLSGDSLGTFIDNASEPLLCFGGGGGSGQGNNNNNTEGTNGGGIIIIQANVLDGNGFTINASSKDVDGYNGQSPARFDGAGGGGAGGSIFMDVNLFEDVDGNTNATLQLDVHGGNGGTNEDNTGGAPDGSCYAPGGGGSGGVIWFTHPNMASVNTSTTVTTLISGGSAGTISACCGAAGACIGSSNGATAGRNGVIQFMADSLTESEYPLTCVLPVEWWYFDVNANENGLPLLSFGTLMELNVAYYLVTGSLDGSNFTVLDTIFTAGNARYPMEYSYLDNSSRYGLHFYQIVQADFNGDISKSTIQTFQYELHVQIHIHPIPVHNTLQVFIETELTSEINFSITNMLGQELIKDIIFSNQLTEVAMPFASGQYIVTVNFEGKTYQRSIQKF